jgi:hypothetical protein
MAWRWPAREGSQHKAPSRPLLGRSPGGLGDHALSAPMVRDRCGRCQGRGSWRKGDGTWRPRPRLGRRRRHARGQRGAAGRTRRGGVWETCPPGEISQGRSVGGQAVMAGASAGAGGPGPSVSAGRRAARIWRTATGSSTVVITRSRPPQRGHANTSIANTRCRSVATAGDPVTAGLRGHGPAAARSPRATRHAGRARRGNGYASAGTARSAPLGSGVAVRSHGRSGTGSGGGLEREPRGIHRRGDGRLAYGPRARRGTWPPDD